MDVADLWKTETPDLYGMRSALDGGGLFCGTEMQAFAIAGVTYQWPRSIKKLTWSVGFNTLGKLSGMDCKDVLSKVFEDFAASCDRQFEFTSDNSKANLLYLRDSLDGRSGTLAIARIPTGNLTPASQLDLRFDDAEVWGIGDNLPLGQIDFLGVSKHETGHSMGSGHEPANIVKPSIMKPIYDPATRMLQEIDKQEMVRRYGSPSTPPPVPTGPPPNSKPIEFELNPQISKDGLEYNPRVRQADKEWGLDGARLGLGKLILPRIK